MTHTCAPVPADFIARPRFGYMPRTTLLALAVAVVVFGGVTMAYASVVESMEASQRVPSKRAPLALDEAPAPVEAEPAKARRSKGLCGTCGIVETIRRLDAVGDLPAAYEFTLRLRDGTTRTSSAASLGNWRAGDHVMVIGGARASLQ